MPLAAFGRLFPYPFGQHIFLPKSGDALASDQIQMDAIF
jgi:hypothetical protein